MSKLNGTQKTALAVIAGGTVVAPYAYQQEVQATENEDLQTTTEKEVVSEAKVSKFSLYSNTDLLNMYNNKFKVSTDKFEISNNGGSYNSGSQLENVLDGDTQTFWETRTPNSASKTNEVTFKFKELTEINRLIYAPRLVGAAGKGFPLEFEIQAITSDSESFKTIAVGKYSSNVRDAIEIEFPSQEVKEVKFVFTKANQDYAAASEFMFYTKDKEAEKMTELFTDSTHAIVSEKFTSEQALTSLEEDVKDHPLYETEYKAMINDARALLEKRTVQMIDAKMETFNHYSNEAYVKEFKVDSANIKSIKHNGNTYQQQVLKNAIDGNVDTYWETASWNSDSFKNTVEVEFNNAVEINRLVYGARKDNKGFANTFDIYVSPTSTGETYELVSSGSQNTVSGLVEAQFNPTKAKRVKFVFKTSNQNWATLSELAFFTEDKVKDSVDKLFTNESRSALTSDFDSEEELTALEEKAKVHPLYESYLKDRLDVAKKLLKGEVDLKGRVITAEQNGNMVAHAKNNLKFGLGNNFQPTGLAAVAGDKLTVYVEADAGSPLPQLVVSQQEGTFNNWTRSFQLKAGKNEITVPKFNSGNYYNHAVAAGGTIYIHNPYTPEKQKTAPIIRIDGGERIPFLTKDTNVEEFKAFLTDYKERLDADKAEHPDLNDRKLIDVVEVVSDHLVFTGTATGAYTAYITQNYNPLDTVKEYNDTMDKIFKFYGLDGSSEIHDPKAIRENIRLMQPFGYMYAYTEHTGVQGDVMVSMLTGAVKTWGPVHEIGHRMDVNNRLWGESTNNMLAQYMSVDRGQIDQRIPYEDIYKRAFMDSSERGTFTSQGYFLRLGAFWQLEMYYPSYWAKINKLYRERNLSIPNDSVKEDYFVRFSSEVIGQDLTEFFEKHGFNISDETREIVKDLPKPKKAWYLNNSVINYEGTGFTNNASVDVNIKRNEANKTNTLTFSIDNENKEHVLGYEIYRDGQPIGFTATGSFTDSDIEPTKNYEYKVVAYDKKLNELEPVEVKTFKPTISTEKQLTLKLHQEFNAKDYVKALDYQGNDITDIVEVDSNVNTKAKGDYKVTYTVTNQGTTETKTINVTVTSDFDYLSDLQAKSHEIAWGGLKLDKAPQGTDIKLLRDGVETTYKKGIGAHANSQVVYDVEGKDYAYFEAYIGIDQAMKGNNSSAKFEVWVDDEKVYTSGVFGSGTEHEFIKVPIKDGAKTVKLVTTDAGTNSNTADHTVWADAKFTKDGSKPVISITSEATKVGEPIDILGEFTATDIEDGDLTAKVKVTGAEAVDFNQVGDYTITYTVTDSDGNEVTATRTISVVDMQDFNYLSAYDWKSESHSYATPVKDKATSGNVLRLTGEDGKEVVYDKGIGAHATSTIVYDLTDKKVAYFTAYVGVDRHMYNSVGSVVFQVYVDGEKKFDSGLMTAQMAQKYIEVNLAGAKELKLVVTDGDNGIGSDHATWGDAKLHYVNEDRTKVKEVPTPSSDNGVQSPIEMVDELPEVTPPSNEGQVNSPIEYTGIAPTPSTKNDVQSPIEVVSPIEYK